MILGDFSCYSTIWGCKDTHQKGRTLETIINNSDLCIYNDKTLTYINPFIGNNSAIDLAICDPSVYMDFSWKVLVDICSSDHLPIVLHNSEHNDKNPLCWTLGGAN